MHFLNINTHPMPIRELKHIYEQMGHKITSWNVHSMWKGIAGQEYKEMILETLLHCRKLSNKDVEIFQKKYNLEPYDGFILTYPISFLRLLYDHIIKTKKPVIIYNCARYEYPLTGDTEAIIKLNIKIKKLYDKKQLLWICNNKGDIWYVKYHLDIEPIYISTIADYMPEKYKIESDKFVYPTRCAINDISKINKIISADQLSIGKSNNLYSWKDFYHQRGMILWPYHNSLMTFFEAYNAGIPIFVCSKKMSKKLFNKKKMYNIKNSVFYRYEIYGEITFYRLMNIEEPTELLDPNCLSNKKNQTKWIELSDHYDEAEFPHLIYFNSIQHLNSLLFTITDAELIEISKKMHKHNETRRKRIYNSWKSVLNLQPQGEDR